MVTKQECPICGAKERKFFFDERIDNITIPIVKCKKCGLVYTPPVIFCRDQKDFQPAVVTTKEKSDFYIKECWSVLVKLRNFVNQNSLLIDIGCARGFFLDLVKKFGYKTVGVELDMPAANVAIYKGHKIFTGDILDILLPLESADVVVMLHTLEHLKHLKFVIKKVKSILKQNGIIVIEVPNLWYWIIQKKLFLTRILDAKRHLYHFTPVTLIKLLRISGFKILRIEPANRYEKKKLITEIFQFIIKILTFYLYFFSGIILSNSIRLYAKKS